MIQTMQIDEPTAWGLLQAIPPTFVTPQTVHHHRKPAAWLQVYPEGQWKTSLPPTEQARTLIELFLPLRIASDFVVAQLGQSLDGRIATVNGHSHYITGSADIVRLHRLRAVVDAVIVGAGTIVKDNPRLTVRAAPGKNPTRVVIDPNRRLENSKHIFTDDAAPTILIRRSGQQANASSPDGTVANGLTEIELPQDAHGCINPAHILSELRKLGFRRFLIEGGGVTVSRFLEAKTIDRLHITVAPLLIGSGRPALTLDPIANLDNAIRPKYRLFRLDDDVLFDLELRSLHSFGTTNHEISKSQKR